LRKTIEPYFNVISDAGIYRGKHERVVGQILRQLWGIQLLPFGQKGAEKKDKNEYFFTHVQHGLLLTI
jgi:hypothetical protein